MESIDLELGELFDRDAIDEDEGDDAGAARDGDPADGVEEQEGIIRTCHDLSLNTFHC